jgi:hypothetical protein
MPARLLKGQGHASAIGVGIRQGIAAERAAAGQQLAGRIVSIARGANAVHHVRHAIQNVVRQLHGAGARVGNVGQVADRVVGVAGIGFGGAPAVGQAVIRIVGVREDDAAGLIELVGDAAILVVVPGRSLVFAVRQRQQVAGRIVAELRDLEVGIRLGGLAPGWVVGVAGGVAELVGYG